MKKIITILMMSLFATVMFAQAPQKMSYQAVVRNAANALITNANVGMRISVLQGTASGTAVYVETQTATTSANGLVTLEIGAGTVVSGAFASISWGTDAYFIKTETDPAGGTNYTIVGTSQFLSVPYALFAANSGSSASSMSGTTNKLIKFASATTGADSQISDDGTIVKLQPNNYAGFTEGVSKLEIAGSDNSIRLIGNGPDFGEGGKLNFGDADIVYISEDEDDNLLIKSSGRTAIMGGSVGIGTLTPGAKLDVNGYTKTYGIQITSGAGEGKVLTSNENGLASWETPAAIPPPATVNQNYEKYAADLTTAIQGAEVDFPTTNVIVPESGTYLITYYLDAYNTFSIAGCVAPCTSTRLSQTLAYVDNKSDNHRLQSQRIDFLDEDSYQYSGNFTQNYSMPAHQISGSVVSYLSANNQIGFKMKSVVGANSGAPAGGEIKIRESKVTLVRLY